MQATLLALLAGLCWGIGEVFTRAVLHTKEVAPLAAIAVRTTVALPVLWLVWGVSRAGLAPGDPVLLERASAGTVWRLLLGSGLLAGAAGMAFFYGSLAHGEVSRVKPIAFGVAPAVAALAGWLALGESLTPAKGIGLALIVAGVVLLCACGGR
jgi:uncharacterized membrane protein